jgi:hypothetical protein
MARDKMDAGKGSDPTTARFLISTTKRFPVVKLETNKSFPEGSPMMSKAWVCWMGILDNSLVSKRFNAYGVIVGVS